MQTYLHLLSPAMHRTVAPLREHHLTEAARLETEIDLLTLEGRALVKAKNPQFANKGRLYLEKADAKRAALRAHLIAATELTDYSDPEPSEAWYSRALTAAAEAGRTFQRSDLDTPNPIYARQNPTKRAA